MMLTDIPGQDVENLGNKISKMTRWISKIGSAPIDLSILVVTAFVDCGVLAFRLKATGLYNLVKVNPKSLSTDEIIWTLKTKFWNLNAQGL